MAVGKEIRTKIKSVQNTQKITRAMEMVAASKMRKAQEAMAATRPYAERIRDVIGHLAKARPEYKNAYMEEREPKRVAFIIISTDRGLCGGLNAGLFRVIAQAAREWRQKNVEISFCLIGRKAEAFFKRYGGDILAQSPSLGDRPDIKDLIGTTKVVFDAYQNGEIDRLYLAYNDFVSTMVQQSTIQQLLPLVPTEDEAVSELTWDYIYEPEPKELIDALLTRYIESQTYQAVVENNACEQAARMVAMKSASDNAAELIDDLRLVYNKARQASITQELSEIVAGAAAV